MQLARIAGLGKIIVVAGPSNSDQLKLMGATHVIDRHGSATDIAQQIKEIVGSEDVTQVYSCAQLQLDLVVAILSASKSSRLRCLLPVEAEEAEKLKEQRPLCDAQFMDDITNESLKPYTDRFWREVPQRLTHGKILPTKYRVIQGLERVQETNEALDTYRDLARAGPQTVVKVEW